MEKLCFTDFKTFKASSSKVEYINLACSVNLVWSGGNISLLVRQLHLPILPDDNGNIFAASLLISYCSFFSLYTLNC